MGVLIFVVWKLAPDPSSSGSAPSAYVGVILPDLSSGRWQTLDRPVLEAAFKKAGIRYEIGDAQGTKGAFLSVATEILGKGVNVLVIVSPDGDTGTAVLQAARTRGVTTIDYYRLTPGGAADYYVSFDQQQTGRAMGEGLQKCLSDLHVDKPLVATLNGAPTDPNSALFAAGYNAVLDPLYAAGTFRKGPDESVPGWDNATAGSMFTEMLKANPKINGVLAANDGLADAVISVLRGKGLAGKVPVTGQDATVQALQHVLSGDQCLTVYKSPRSEATALAGLAAAVAPGAPVPTTQTVRDNASGKDVKAVLLKPTTIFANNVQDVINDGYVSTSQLCTPTYADRRKAAGIR